MKAELTRRWESDWVELATAIYPADSDHYRQFCPYWQHWLLLSGDWREESQGSDTLLRQGMIHTYEPFQKCRRVAASQLNCISLRLKQEVSTATSTKAIWQTYRDYALGDPDSLEIDARFTLEIESQPTCDERKAPIWLVTVRDYLVEEPHRQDSLRQLADRASVSPYHLCHEFKRWYGVSIAQFRRQQRLASACRNLIEGKESHSFYDASHFNRSARAEYGITASELKRVLRVRA
jgi:AraC-like DNA-binding protein